MNERGDLVDRTAELAPGFIADLTDARDVLIGDFTNDGWPDVVIANTFVQQPKFYRNLGEDGKGNWLGLADESTDRFPVIEVANMAGPKFCAVSGGDVNGDNAPDIFFSNDKQPRQRQRHRPARRARQLGAVSLKMASRHQGIQEKMKA